MRKGRSEAGGRARIAGVARPQVEPVKEDVSEVRTIVYKINVSYVIHLLLFYPVAK